MTCEDLETMTVTEWAEALGNLSNEAHDEAMQLARDCPSLETADTMIPRLEKAITRWHKKNWGYSLVEAKARAAYLTLNPEEICRDCDKV